MGKYSWYGSTEGTAPKGDFILAGNHILKHVMIADKASPKGHNNFVITCEVVSSDNPLMVPGQHRVCIIQQIERFNPKDPQWQKDVKAYVSAVSGENDYSSGDEADLETALSAKNPLAGCQVRCVGKQVNPEKPFVKCYWSVFTG